MADDDIEFEAPLTVKPGQIQFVDACHPPLVAGDYRVDMRQTLKDDEQAPGRWSSDPYATALEFSVDAARFVLKPADIHSMYPPANQDGAFGNTLPQVVFTRRTLPWERTLDGSAPRLSQPFPPWLALLLLRDDELCIRDANGNDSGERRALRPLPVIHPLDQDGKQQITADCLLYPTRVEVRAPDLGQQQAGGAWQQHQERYRKTSCLSLDLPAELFKAIAPRTADLPWLAHVRQVDTGDKEVYANNDKGWFSVLVGNRMPRPPDENADLDSVRHHAYLVSLEGWQDCLDPAWRPPPGQLLRLAVLGNWSFDCSRGLDFKGRMDRLNLAPDDTSKFPHSKLPDPWLRMPYQPFNDYPGDGSEASPEDLVNAAHARGYGAFRHRMRQGETTLSWYRGPLVPLHYAKPIQIQNPVRYSDALLCYDPDSGLFDTAYAAAWQLGRLLALQNQAFALALSRVRAKLRQDAERSLRAAELVREADALGLAPGDLEDALVDWLAAAKLDDSIPE